MTGQQLRNSILQMAVQGKLVPQDPNDEPASVLLERIRAEKERLIKEKKIKKEKNPSRIFRGADNLPYEQVGDKEPVCITDEVPFEIPKSWEWVRFSSVITLQSGQDMTPDKYNANSKGIPYITGASNIDNGHIIINRWTEDGKSFAYKGDLLLTCKGTVGTMAILLEEKVHIARQIMAIHPNHNINTEYIQLVMESFIVQLKARAKSMIPGIKREDVLQSLLPLPPYSEQNRIIKRFHLMRPLIEEYDKRNTALTLLNKNFPERLKSSIFQWAVQGKLVPQDPNDEPASILLEKIRAEKERLIAEGKIKRNKHESIIYRRGNSHYEKIDGVERCIDDEIPFNIPDSWEWVRLINIFKFIDYRGITPTKTSSGIPFLTAKNVKKGYLDYSTRDFISFSEYEKRKSRGISRLGDILFTTEAPLGNVALADLEYFSAGQRLITLQQYSSHSYLLNRLYVYFILSDSFQKQLICQSTGTTVKGIKAERLKKILLPFPPYEEQKRIIHKIEQIFSLISLM